MTEFAYYARTTYGTRDKLRATTDEDAWIEAEGVPYYTSIVKVTVEEIPWSKGSTSQRRNTRRATKENKRTTALTA